MFLPRLILEAGRHSWRSSWHRAGSTLDRTAGTRNCSDQSWWQRIHPVHWRRFRVYRTVVVAGTLFPDKGFGGGGQCFPVHGLGGRTFPVNTGFSRLPRKNRTIRLCSLGLTVSTEAAILVLDTLRWSTSSIVRVGSSCRPRPSKLAPETVGAPDRAWEPEFDECDVFTSLRDPVFPDLEWVLLLPEPECE